MARSLNIKTQDNIVIDGGNDTTINFMPDGGTYEFFIRVDNSVSQSFEIDKYNKWFDYKIERYDDIVKKKDSYCDFTSNNYGVKVTIIVPKNYNTLSRYGYLDISHKSANLSIRLNIFQEPSVYSLNAKYETDGIFKVNPGVNDDGSENTDVYEEKVVTIKTNGGSGKWYVKDIEQYEAFDTFSGEGTKNGDEITDADRKNESRVEYDGALQYRIEGDKLIVRSFGQIDLSGTHMRYYFIICHGDIDNTKKDYNTDEYETSQLFVFKGDRGLGYGDGLPYEPNINPGDKYAYVFLINGKKSPSASVNKIGGTLPVTILSERNGENWTDVSFGNPSQSWCTISSDGKTLTISENTSLSTRTCTITYTQNRHDGTKEDIVLTIVQSGASQTWLFTVDGNSTDFEYETPISFEGGSHTPEVVSKKGQTDIEYSVYPYEKVGWARYNPITKQIEFDPNNGAERYVTFTFKQGGGSPLEAINVVYKQEKWVKTNFKYTIHYYEKDTTNKLHNDTEGIGHIGDTLNFEYIPIEGYTLISPETQPLTITDDESQNVLIFEYSQQTTYVVHHYLKDTTTSVADDDNGEANVGDVVTVHSKSVSGYSVVGETQQQLTITKDSNVAIFYYTQDVSYKFEVHYYIKGTTTPVNREDEETGSAAEGETITRTRLNFSGYDFAEPDENITKSITISTDESKNVIIFYYKDKYNARIRHYETGTDKQIAPEDVMGGSIGVRIGPLTHFVKNIPGYVFNYSDPSDYLVIQTEYLSDENIAKLYYDPIGNNKITFKGGSNMTDEYDKYLMNFDIVDSEGNKYLNYEVSLHKAGDSVEYSFPSDKDFYLVYTSGVSDGEISISQNLGGTTDIINRDNTKKVKINNQNGEVVEFNPFNSTPASTNFFIDITGITNTYSVGHPDYLNFGTQTAKTDTSTYPINYMDYSRGQDSTLYLDGLPSGNYNVDVICTGMTPNEGYYGAYGLLHIDLYNQGTEKNFIMEISPEPIDKGFYTASYLQLDITEEISGAKYLIDIHFIYR